MSADLAPTTTNMAGLSKQQREASITSYLEVARDRLTWALDATGPEQVANLKAEIATASEAAKQLGLSKEIRDDASEMVRRAEYSVRKAVTKAQAEGEVARPKERHDLSPTGDKKPEPESFFSSRKEWQDANAMGSLDGDQFEEVLTEAKAEGNLSRAHVAEKARTYTRPEPTKQRRRPLTDASRDAGWDLRKAVERIERIAEDDRFQANKDEVAPQLRGHLTNTIQVCQDLLDRINN